MNNNIRYFFAAANSYNGFVSYFDKIFFPSDYEKIFILKGGPGTGKSRFIKDVIEAFDYDGVNCEAVLCSSDPKSFDGLILEKSNKKIAIIDGTAPHATDPIYPGAVDKIINLGDSWNEALLKNNREKIEELTNCKKYYYKSAYQYLSIAKKCAQLVDEAVNDIITDEYRETVTEVLSEVTGGDKKTKIRLKTAFGKQGFFELDSAPRPQEKRINVVGIYGSEYLFMSEIVSEAKKRSADYTISPSPLDEQKTDLIFFEANNLCISVGNKNSVDKSNIIDTSKYIDVKKFEFLRNKLETIYKEREAMLWCATDEFKKAYDAHMEVEKIYTASMNFKKNKKLLDKVCSEIKSILFPEDFSG